MDKPTILLQLDTDAQPSVFDRVVAVDAGAQHIFSHGGVTPDVVQGLVHGCIFTRGPKDLHRTAVFIGGSDLAAGEKILSEVKKHLLPQYGLRVSVMLDSNGANTTAAAAVRAAAKHLKLKSTTALVLGGTGPVGQRVARLLVGQGATVRLGSRQKARAETVCTTLRAVVQGAKVEPVAIQFDVDAAKAFDGVELVVAAGAAGVVLLPKKVRSACKDLKVAIDLNAVPPAGIEGVEAMDSGQVRDGLACYGALGVGGPKMKLHKAAVAALFTRNDLVLDAEEIYALG
ncbi:MAG: NAD(P)-dependent methylenetetrahydromethanopterin dehydrogenase [Gemmataceae bacterium]